MESYRIPRVMATEVVISYEEGKRGERGTLIGKEEADKCIELSVQRPP